jgi:WD40 repeat protein
MGHDGPVQAVLFSPDDTLLCSAGRDKKIHIWDAKEGKKTKEIGEADGELLNLANGAGDFFSCGADKQVRRYNFAAEKRGIYSGHKDWVYALAIDTAQKRLATGAFDGEVRIWDLESGRLLNAFVAVAGLESTRAAKGP